MVDVNDRVIYWGPHADLWGLVGIVKMFVPGGEVALQFPGRERWVHACRTELVHAGEKR
jgi:hypothetical protein